MKILIQFAALLWIVFLAGCEAEEVGCLIVDNALYSPDTVYFKAVLDPDNPEDARRLEFNIPWETGILQGLEGDYPRNFRIADIRCEESGSESAGQFYMDEGISKVRLPCKHTVLPGMYVFSVEVSNEGGKNSYIRKDAVVIVIK